MKFDPRRVFTQKVSRNLHLRARADGCVNIWLDTPDGWQVIDVALSYTAANLRAQKLINADLEIPA